MLTLDKITKHFGGRTIFDGASWAMPDDGRVGLVGLNGAGKSTLLRIIAELMQPDGGRISRPQRTPRRLPASGLARDGRPFGARRNALGADRDARA